MESEIDIGEEYWLYHEKYIVSQHNFECNSCWCNYRVHTVSTPYCVSMSFYHERTQLKIPDWNLLVSTSFCRALSKHFC